MPESRKIPLFPLGVVLLPEMRLPLHIFEKRYRRMIADCLAEDKPFGIVLFDGQAVRAVGCLARITEITNRYDDGRMDIMTRGMERFVIQKLYEEQAYLEAQVFLFDDVDEPPDEELPDLVANAWHLLTELVDIDVGIDPAVLGGRTLPQRLSFAIGALEGFSPAERQGFLEMTSPSERLKKAVQALSRLVARNRLTREIQQMIGGNGHPPQSILREIEGHFKG